MLRNLSKSLNFAVIGIISPKLRGILKKNMRKF